MITRRGFFGTVAALVVAPRVMPEPLQVTGYIFSLGGRPLANPFPIYGGTAGAGKSMSLRRDDGDTILELR